MNLLNRIVGEDLHAMQLLAVALPSLIDLHEESVKNPVFVQMPVHLVLGPVGVSFAVPDNFQSPIQTSHFLSSGGGVGLEDCP